MSKKILLVGCGELGSRHLQAVASLNNIDEIHIVDPRPEAFELGKKRLKEINDINRDIHFNWFHKLDKSSAGGNLCIVATRAQERCALVKEIAEKLGYKNFLVEKVVSQSVREYQDLLSFCENKSLSVWVNCKTRAYSIHKYIKSKLNSDEPIIFSAIGGNHGLFNNGIHEVDLFVFHDGTSQIKSSGSQIDQILYPSKRGSNIYDLSGSLCGYSDKGSKFIVSFAGDHISPDHITINSPSCRFIVDHFQRFAYESYPESDWSWRNIPIPIKENWNVSHMSKRFVSNILEKDDCELPTLVDCYPAHQFILSQLLPHFNCLLGTDNDYCPGT